MAPSGSKILGNATIWNKDNEVGDGGEFEWFNSQLYPIIIKDNLSVDAELAGIFLQQILKTYTLEESIEVTAKLNLIFLETTVIRSTYEYGTESMYVEANLMGIEFVQVDPPVVHTYEFEDSMDITADLTGVFLETVVGYIEYEYDESMTVSADLTGIDFNEDVI